jgi:hypothetical protein
VLVVSCAVCSVHCSVQCALQCAVWIAGAVALSEVVYFLLCIRTCIVYFAHYMCQTEDFIAVSLDQ